MEAWTTITTIITDVIGMFGDVLGVFLEPPLVWFVGLAVLGWVARRIFRLVKRG